MWIDDDILKRCAEPLAVSCWIPANALVVLGSSNQAAAEVDVERCLADGVAILKRYGGGGTVVLYPGCVVVSIGTWVRQHFNNGFYFQRLNQAVITCLTRYWPVCQHLVQRGLSDIACGERKIAGTSLFRSRNYLLYQASILVENDINLIGKYLRHPTREPDYRQGRSHAAFLMGLCDLDPRMNVAAVLKALEGDIAEHALLQLEGDCIEPVSEQYPGLLRRAQGCS